MKILITGVNGFIASHLICKLDPQIYDIYGLDIQNESCHNLKKYFQIDITKPFNLDIEFDIILHLAALNRTNVDADFEYELFHKINVIGTKNILLDCKYKKFIYFSSASIYAKDGEVAYEDSDIILNSNYTKSKYEAEIICKESIPKEKLIILRPVNIVGIKQKEIASIPIFFKKAINNETIDIFVPKNRIIQLLNIDDLILLLKMIFNSNIYGVYNVAPKDYITIEQLIKRIINICNSKSIVRISNNTLENQLKVSCGKLKKQLNWKAKKSIDDTILEYYEAVKKT